MVAFLIGIVHLAAIVAQAGLILFGLNSRVRNIETVGDGLGGHSHHSFSIVVLHEPQVCREAVPAAGNGPDVQVVYFSNTVHPQ